MTPGHAHATPHSAPESSPPVQALLHGLPIGLVFFAIALARFRKSLAS